MNSGAIKITENLSDEVLGWIHSIIDPDYKVIKSGSGITYYVGKSDLFCNKHYSPDTHNVYYAIISTENTFKLKLESWSYVRL